MLLSAVSVKGLLSLPCEAAENFSSCEVTGATGNHCVPQNSTVASRFSSAYFLIQSEQVSGSLT